MLPVSRFFATIPPMFWYNLEAMTRVIISFIVVICAMVIFHLVRIEFGIPFGLRTFFPAFIALFFYVIYVITIYHLERGKAS